MELEQSVIDDFRRDGVAILRGAFSKDWIETLRRGLEHNIKTPGPYTKGYSSDDGPGKFFGDYCNWQRIPEYEDFVRNSPVSAYARDLMGSRKARFFHEHVVVKEPGTLEKTPWHHDQPYYCVDGDDSVSLWVPLDPVPQQWGVEFIAGSHKWNRWFRPTKFIGVDYEQDNDGFEPVPDFDSERDQHNILSFDLDVGDCIAFHFRTVHGAPGNGSTTTRRRAIAWRWTGDDARYVERNGVMSPPFHEMDACTLKPGDPLEGTLFPAFDGH
jgi:ectoine hydroxylase-related dioxygenase (phytanoyl-CoA dioxygenase family)